MRIESIETFVAGHWLFVAVTTECGRTGFGESTYFPHPLAGVAVLDDLRGEMIGADARRPEHHFNRLLKHHCLRDSAQLGALSALDQAMWDLKGKALSAPVHELLGGRVRDRVRAILLIEADTDDALIKSSLTAAEEGFTAIKIKPFLSGWAELSTARLLRDIPERVSRVREVLGWDVDIAVEVHRNLTPALAVEFAHAIRDTRPYFIEDPVLPFGVTINADVANAMPGVIALAERNLNIWEFRDMSDIRGVSILRPDVGLAGGFTQVKKIAAIAESRGQRIVPHNFTSPFVTACHIQLAACTPNWDVQGYVREARAPWLDVVDAINVVRDGFLEIPERPGVGMNLNLDYLRSAQYEPFGAKFHHGAVRGVDGGVKHQ